MFKRLAERLATLESRHAPEEEAAHGTKVTTQSRHGPSAMACASVDVDGGVDGCVGKWGAPDGPL